MSSDDDLGSFIDPNNITSTNTYESTIVDSFQKGQNAGTIAKSIEDTKNAIVLIKSKLANATLNGNSSLIEKYQKQLDEETAKLEDLQNLPTDYAVNLDLSVENNSNENFNQLPEQNDELMKYWHYKVMHTSFAGKDSINLTIDDSDLNVFISRTAFIKDHCEPYTEITQIKDNLVIPKAIWNSLYPHQKVAVEWLWEKWNDKHGGIEGDEMGLGKTAITCCFLQSLQFSNILKNPILILSPLTVTQQWIRELHIWCPQFRSILLHSTRANRQVSQESLLEHIDLYPTVIVTNYETLRRESVADLMMEIEWGAVICDEGHKIRNYKTIIAQLVKKLPSMFHLAITGTPIQNSLVELWSLFDFAVPNLLGSIACFDREFAGPIKRGGFSNANPMDVLKAYKLAVALRDLIKPYILRRLKKDVNVQLPMKTEQILFLNLVPAQIQAYQDFLESTFYRRILSGECEIFVGIDFVRKICNHPCLAEPRKYKQAPELSCKLNLLTKILPQWKKQNHRVLIFSQYLRMLDFIGLLCIKMKLTFFRLDGRTPSQKRTQYIDRFNAGEKFAVIASTKVGGIGVNLTGADRVIIVDPDWNPSNDIQALQRAWRIGQKRDVAVYRLISVGTIEEKMYKKQIIKSFLSEKILSDPNQKRMFTPDTVKDLFKLDMEIEPEFLIQTDIHQQQEETENESNTHENSDEENNTYKYMINSEDEDDEESMIERYSTDGLSDEDEDVYNDRELMPNDIDSTTVDLTSSSDIESDSDEVSMSTSELTEHSIECASDDEELLNRMRLVTEPAKTDNDGQVQNSEKEMVQHLLTDGDLRHAFSIEQIFSGKTDSANLLKSQENVQKSVNSALMKLKRSTKNDDEEDDEMFQMPQTERRLRKTLLDLFKHNQKVLTSSDIAVYFKNSKEVYDAKQLRKHLRSIATLNKESHVWKLNDDYSQCLLNDQQDDHSSHKNKHHHHHNSNTNHVVRPFIDPSSAESKSRPFISLAGLTYNEPRAVDTKIEYIKSKDAKAYLDRISKDKKDEKAKKYQLFPDKKPKREIKSSEIKSHSTKVTFARIERTKGNEVFAEVVDLLNRHHGKLESSKITSYFNTLSLPKNPELLKSTLKIVAVLNKRTHIWHLKEAYKTPPP